MLFLLLYGVWLGDIWELRSFGVYFSTGAYVWFSLCLFEKKLFSKVSAVLLTFEEKNGYFLLLFIMKILGRLALVVCATPMLLFCFRKFASVFL